MSDITKLVEQIVAGDNATAKDTFDSIISERALDYLSEYKRQLSSSVFGGVTEAKKDEEEDEEEDEEDEDEEEDEEDEEEDSKDKKKEMKESVNPRQEILSKVRARIGL